MAKSTGVDKTTVVAVIEGVVKEVKRSVIDKENVCIRGLCLEFESLMKNR